jgi:hypothetical protein
MYVYRLKFETKEQFDSLKLPAKSIITVVQLGQLYHEAISEDEQPEPIEGYHVDIKTVKLIPAFTPYIVTPEHPRHGVRWSEGCKIVQP